MAVSSPSTVPLSPSSSSSSSSQSVPEPRRSTLLNATGESLALYDWPAVAPLRNATILIVHGLGEHAGRYGALAADLCAAGFAVRAYDHCGHGLSYGIRGAIPESLRFLDDLRDVVDATRALLAGGSKLLVLGHSMGGLVTSSFVSRAVRPVDGLVLSAPALDAGLNCCQKLLLGTLPYCCPGMRVHNGLDSAYLSHDAAVVAAYRADPLVHSFIGARTAKWLADEGPLVIAAAPAWRVPTLLLWAGKDRLVAPRGCAAFAAAASPALVARHCFEELYHEIFNEVEAERKEVVRRLLLWLTEQVPLAS